MDYRESYNRNLIIEDIETKILSSEDKVLKLVKSKGEITRRDVEELLGCSAFPATKILNTLIKKAQIEKIGSARATRYIFKK